MILLADENIHRLIVSRLREDGHDVVHIGDMAPGVTDQQVMEIAVEREALLLTNDLDFGELVFVGAARHAGVLLIRFGELPYAKQAELVAHTVSREGEALHGAFSVLTAARFRTRSTSAAPTKISGGS